MVNICHIQLAVYDVVNFENILRKSEKINIRNDLYYTLYKYLTWYFKYKM